MTGSANITTNRSIKSYNNIVGDATWQLSINQPTALISSAIQTIQQGTGYNQNLTIQALGGNVGIGTTTTSS